MIIRNGSWEECIHMNIVVRGSGLTGAQELCSRSHLHSMVMSVNGKEVYYILYFASLLTENDAFHKHILRLWYP